MSGSVAPAAPENPACRTAGCPPAAPETAVAPALISELLAPAGLPPAGPATSDPGPAGVVSPTPANAGDAYHLLPDAVIVMDPAGLVLGLNHAAEKLLGADPAATIGQPLAELAPLTDETGRDWWECQSFARATRSIQRVPERALTLGPQGPAVLLTARYVREEGALRQVLLMLRDTTARERIERNHADLISTVAHELRSPLTSVKGFTATMLSKWDRFGDDQKRQMLEWINNDADRVTRLLAELLDVSRIDAGRLELHRQVVDLQKVTERAFAGRIAGGEPAERFTLDVQGTLPEMWLDPDKIEQVVGNLIENALRHGAGTVRVTIIAEAEGARVDIEDEGDGVPDDIAVRVFSKFFRGKARRGGTGLGLYIVKGLVEAHSGTVAVERAPGGGARFRFWLPAGSPTYAI